MAKVVRFPPLPSIPQPEEAAPDERQQTFNKIVGNIAGAMADSPGTVLTINTVTGFRASAVDLGFLQDTLSRSIEHLDMAGVRERWDEDLRPWFYRVLATWIQRCKEMTFHVNENGIRIELETQDDRGYYNYTFAVFPGRE